MGVTKLNNHNNTGKPVNEMSYEELHNYIRDKYVSQLSDAVLEFSNYGNSFSYNLNDKNSKDIILKEYKENADYTEKTLEDETDYKMDGWEIKRKDGYELRNVNSDNTYNNLYKGLIDLNFGLFHDDEEDKWFYVIHPHLGGDIRGIYGEAFIIEGDDELEILERLYEDFISGSVSAYFKFKDGSSVSFVSEQEFDVVNFQLNELNTSLKGNFASKLVDDYNLFSKEYDRDYFLEGIIESYDKKNNIDKMSGGGGVVDSPRAYIQILGYSEGKWMNLDDYTDGDEFIEAITDWMEELNADGVESKGSPENREEWEVADWDGFGQRYYSPDMSESDFDEVYESYEAFESASYPLEVVEAYMSENGIDEMASAISTMDDTSYGTYDSMKDWAYDMVEEGVFTPESSSEYMYVTDTDKRILSGEEADHYVGEMDFEEALNKSDMVEEFNSQKENLEEIVSEIEERLETAEELMSDSEGDDYDSASEVVTEIEEELENAQENLDNLEQDMDVEVRDKAISVYYDEIYDRLENDLDGYLSELGYEKPTDASFVSIDYNEMGDDFSGDFTKIHHDGSYYLFTDNYARGGKLLDLSKPASKYKFFVVEMTTKKIESGWNSKKDADKHRKSILSKYPKHRFSVYKKDIVSKKYNLDTDTYSDFIKLDNEVKVKPSIDKRKRDVSVSTKISDAIVNRIKALKKVLSKSVDNDKKAIQKQIKKLKTFYYKETKSFSLGGALRGARDKGRKGKNWLQKQWTEADFGDGSGKAKFDKGGGTKGYEDLYGAEIVAIDKIKRMSDDDVLDEANTISYYERIEDGEPEITDVKIARLYLVEHYTHTNMAGGEPTQLVFVDNKLLARIKKVITKKDGSEKYILTSPDGNRSLGKYKSNRVSVAKDGGEAKGSNEHTSFYVATKSMYMNSDSEKSKPIFIKGNIYERRYRPNQTSWELINEEGRLHNVGDNWKQYFKPALNINSKEVALQGDSSYKGFNNEKYIVFPPIPRGLGGDGMWSVFRNDRDTIVTLKNNEGSENMTRDEVERVMNKDYHKLDSDSGSSYKGGGEINNLVGHWIRTPRTIYRITSVKEISPTNIRVTYDGGYKDSLEITQSLTLDEVQSFLKGEIINEDWQDYDLWKNKFDKGGEVWISYTGDSFDPKNVKEHKTHLGANRRMNNLMENNDSAGTMKKSEYLDGSYKGGGDTWIQDSVKSMEKKGTIGAFTKQSKEHGMKPVEFAKEVLGNPDKYTEKTRERAQFVKNTNPEKFD